MQRISKLFSGGKKPIISVFTTAGFPKLGDTLPLLKTLEESGADMVEIGMPFSDPLADGPVIQAASEQALKNGMNLDVLFTQLKGLRPALSIPVVLMGYYNPVMQYGIERFCKDAAACGVDGLILPDIPLAEYEKILKPVLNEFKLAGILLVTERSSPERLRYIDGLSEGFLYAVSAPGVTGAISAVGSGNRQLEDYLTRLAAQPLRNPVLIGFGITSAKQVQYVSTFARGAIVGSAFIREISGAADVHRAAASFVKQLREI